MSWLRQNWRWLLIGVVLFVGAILFVILYALRRKAEAEQLRAQLAIMVAQTKVDGLEADRRARIRELAENSLESAKVNGQILEAKKKVLAISTTVDSMTPMQIEAEYKRLGYL